jgi:NhaP-type Na+/H+ or K+/H+ antiporter
MSSYALIILGSLIILTSFVFSAIAKKTNVPSVLLLIVLGIGLQYAAKWAGYDQPDMMAALEVLGIAGLVMIVLEAALDLKLKREKIGVIFRSVVVAIVGLALSVGAAGVIIHYMVPGMTWMQAMLYATPVSILSSAIIIPSVSALDPDKKEFLIYESTFSDIAGIMLFYFILGVMDHNMPMEVPTHEGGPVQSFFVGLAITLGVAIVSSYALLTVFQHIRTGPKLFLLIAILFLLYSVSKLFHLSPLIIILIFGLMVSNQKLFFLGPLKRLLNPEKMHDLEHGLHVVTLETAFVVRTFFFVVFGASIALSSLLSFYVAIVSGLLLISVYVVRWMVLRGVVGQDIEPQIWVAPRGLITVLLFFSIPAEHAYKWFDQGILVFIIIATGIVMTAGMIWNSRQAKRMPPRQEDMEFKFDKLPLPGSKRKDVDPADSSN